MNTLVDFTHNGVVTLAILEDQDTGEAIAWAYVLQVAEPNWSGTCHGVLTPDGWEFAS